MTGDVISNPLILKTPSESITTNTMNGLKPVLVRGRVPIHKSMVHTPAAPPVTPPKKAVGSSDIACGLLLAKGMH